MKLSSKLCAIGLGAALSFIGVSQPSAVRAQANTATEAQSITPVQEYNEYMRLGYAASGEGDFVEAASFFRAALYAVPKDREATIAYWNARAELQSPELSDRAALYENNMGLGYDATDEGDYEAALGYFQAALKIRPRDYYAAQAIRNVSTYLNRGVGADSATDVPTTYQVYAGETPYDRYMRLGYAAVQRQDYAAAQAYFRSALYERDNDRQATIAYWNAVDGVRDGEFGLNSEAPENAYDRYMRLGYDATQRESYERALGFFEQAVAERPNDAYALQAIRNVRAYMNPK